MSIACAGGADGGALSGGETGCCGGAVTGGGTIPRDGGGSCTRGGIIPFDGITGNVSTGPHGDFGGGGGGLFGSPRGGGGLYLLGGGVSALGGGFGGPSEVPTDVEEPFVFPGGEFGPVDGPSDVPPEDGGYLVPGDGVVVPAVGAPSEVPPPEDGFFPVPGGTYTVDGVCTGVDGCVAGAFG